MLPADRTRTVFELLDVRDGVPVSEIVDQLKLSDATGRRIVRRPEAVEQQNHCHELTHPISAQRVDQSDRHRDGTNLDATPVITGCVIDSVCSGVSMYSDVGSTTAIALRDHFASNWVAESSLYALSSTLVEKLLERRRTGGPLRSQTRDRELHLQSNRPDWTVHDVLSVNCPGETLVDAVAPVRGVTV